MRKLIIGMLLTTATLTAEVVMVTANGKTFHSEQGKCIVMRRETTAKAKVERAKAEEKGLRECRSCYRKPSEGKAKSAGRNAWVFATNAPTAETKK